MKTKVKICGISTLDDIGIINKYDVDYAGFVFARSKRQVSIEKAKIMIKNLRTNIKAVGVFVDDSYEQINEVARYCRLDIVQLHGSETIQTCKRIKSPVWKSIPITNKEDIDNGKKYKSVQGILLDNVKGGSGKTFPWQFAKGFSKEHFTIIAGGLNFQNVGEAILQLKPNVVDVSSGVERNFKKDVEKIRKFIREVKNYE